MVDATHRGLRSIRSLSALSGGLLLAAAVLPLAPGLPFVTEAAAQDAAPAKPAAPAKAAAPAKQPTAAQRAKQMKDAKAAADAQRESAAAGQRAYAAGVKAFEGGDIQGAEQQLNVALSGGGLPNAQMARALYYRGSSYRQLGRPAQAISDLTTAVWLKAGLPEDLKAKAMEARKLAYQEAGLGTSPPPVGAAPLDQSASGTPAAPKPGTGVQVVQVTEQGFWSGVSVPKLPSFGGQPTQTAEAATSAAAPAAGAQQPSSFWNFLPSFGGGASQQPAEGVPPAAAGFSTTTVAASPEAASAPAMGFAAPPETTQTAQSSSWDTQTASAAAAEPAPPQTVVASYAPANDAYVPPPAAPAAPAAAGPEASAGTSNPLSGVTGFFSNMFGSSSGGAQPAPADGATVTTGSTETPPGGWSGDTTVVTSQTSSMVQRGPESPPSSPPSSPSAEAMPWTTESKGASAKPAPQKVANAAPTAGAGRYKLQVAAVRSREEAQRLAQSLSSYPAVRDGTVQAEIDEAVIGSMGTFYRVRLGPYADAKEPGQLCTTLKPQGFDCLVVTQ